mmetsp:Transcript_54440/g.117843  ORF Transcript_54440/g.117843 Transcript_54440/m.117843 type:complete len:146 (+) Transcript_54440:22-459(+)
MAQLGGDAGDIVIAGCSGRADELLELSREEVRAAVAERVRECAGVACKRIDGLVLSALRQLPPELRRMPARQAFELSAGGPWVEAQKVEMTMKRLEEADQLGKKILLTTQQLEAMSPEMRHSYIDHLQSQVKNLCKPAKANSGGA